MAAVNLIGSYNYALVALSVLIAMFASYAALDLAGRVTAAGGWTRAVWLLGGAGANAPWKRQAMQDTKTLRPFAPEALTKRLPCAVLNRK